MSVTSSNTSLATRAKKLTALARARKVDTNKGQELAQFQTALNKLGQELSGLRVALTIQRNLQDVGVPASIPRDLFAAPRRLRAQIDEVGRPSAQFLTARSRDVSTARSEIDAANFEVWRDWAARRISGLPLALVPRLHVANREATKGRIDSLRRLAGSKPTVEDIVHFEQSYNRVKEALATVQVGNIDNVLNRFRGGRIRLADLSDAELQILREDESLRDQLYLQLA